MIEGVMKLRMDAFDAIADEIEREVAEKYIALPVDRNGETWRIGDKFSFSEASGIKHVCTVSGIGEDEIFFYYDEDAYSTRHRHFNANKLSHVKLDPYRKLLERFVKDHQDSPGKKLKERCLSEYAEKFRELSGKAS